MFSESEMFMMVTNMQRIISFPKKRLFLTRKRKKSMREIICHSNFLYTLKILKCSYTCKRQKIMNAGKYLLNQLYCSGSKDNHNISKIA